MLKASEIIAATHAVREDFAFTGVTTDSRSVKNGELFVALQGDNMGIKHAAANAVMRFCNFGEDFEKIAQGALKGIFEI